MYINIINIIKIVVCTNNRKKENSTFYFGYFQYHFRPLPLLCPLLLNHLIISLFRVLISHIPY